MRGGWSASLGKGPSRSPDLGRRTWVKSHPFCPAHPPRATPSSPVAVKEAQKFDFPAGEGMGRKGEGCQVGGLEREGSPIGQRQRGGAQPSPPPGGVPTSGEQKGVS